MMWTATWKSYLPRPRSLKSLNPTLSRVSFICKIWDKSGYVSDSEQQIYLAFQNQEIRGQICSVHYKRY
jgi:hypothetical protein